jgi:hypothetical protein
VWVEVVTSTLAGAQRCSPRTAGYPNQRAPMCTSRTRADADPQHRSQYLVRTGFFKPVHMKSLSAHALRSLIIARKKTGGPASDLGESDPRFGGRVREHNRPDLARSQRRRATTAICAKRPAGVDVKRT